jgi:signal-transduction protein with cAMP-binding, CBS, and nucleotidyltransferase domain
MLTIRELLAQTRQRNVTVGPSAAVADALDLLSDHNIGAIVVADAGAPVGILSERDVVRAISASGSDALARPVRDLMTRNVVFCSSAEGLLPSISRMLLHGIRHLPVVDDGVLKGVLSIRDLLSAWIGEERTEQEFLIGLDCAVRRELANTEPTAPTEKTPSFHLVDLDD